MIRKEIKYKVERIIFKSIKYSMVFIIFMLVQVTAEAKDFGKMGQTFEIKEEGFLSMIMRKLKSVDVTKQNEKMVDLARKKVEEPDPVPRITKTTKEESFTFDPTYVLQEDIQLPDGKLLYHMGTKINPLDHMEFDRKLYFIDARDEEQVDWLIDQLKNESLSTEAEKKENRIILVGGRPLDLADKLNTEVYFDQFGELTGKFGIKHVPATVVQEKDSKVLIVREMICKIK